ncbi:molecular chaperone TorD family protein [Endozoicomonas sp. Mp262]|uniref:TorD/DmsD family molecular chaperone n=1 Tax=Endozoicomonas sp. Mp262 TaxID=2919499 RepID=UPI0021D9507B
MSHKKLETLVGLEIACRFLYTALHQPPSEVSVTEFIEEDLFNHWPVDGDEPLVKSGLVLIKDYLGSHEYDKPRRLLEDFNALFIGPEALKAAPWASVYLTEEQLVMTEPTLAVRSFYREFGVEINTGEHEPDDHLGLQLAFISHLLNQAVNAIEQQQPVEPWLQAIQLFLTHHVLTWSGRFLEIMASEAATGFYQGVAKLTEGTLKQLAQTSGAQYQIVRLYR